MGIHWTKPWFIHIHPVFKPHYHRCQSNTDCDITITGREHKRKDEVNTGNVADAFCCICLFKKISFAQRI
ncbi:hypothetical protein R3I94_020239 [Phoxinus phoxinus]